MVACALPPSVMSVQTTDAKKYAVLKRVTWLTCLDVGTNRICAKASKTSMLKYPAGTRDLNFGLSPHLYSYWMYARIEGSNLCWSKTPKRVPLQTMRSQMKSYKTWHFVNTWSTYTGGSRGGGEQGVRTPSEKSQNLGYLGNTVPYPLKKLQSLHSMLGIHRHASETPFKWCFAGGPMMAHLVFWSSISSSTKKKNVIKFGIPLIKLSGSAHENNACIHVINYSLRPINGKMDHPVLIKYKSYGNVHWQTNG